jgi:hypothetical protein
MAETLVETEYCDACGADVRKNSLFCYNCGGAVSADAIDAEKPKEPKAVSSAWFQGDLTENKDLKTTRLEKETVVKAEEKPIAKPVEEPLTDKLPEIVEAEPDEKTAIAEKNEIKEETKLKSAANMRRKAKVYQQKKVEVVWEEPESAPNKWFPIVALVLILIVAAIFYLAMYLR